MRGFLRQALAALAAQVVFVSVCALIVAGLFLRAERAVGTSGGILTIDLGRGLTDRGSEPLVRRLLRGQARNPHALHRLIESVRHAALDDDVKAILLHGSVDGGFSLLRELRMALLEFKGSGKRVFAWFSHYDADALYLASAADDAAISPLGSARFAGLQSEALYLKDLLGTLGVDVQVVRTGEYKSLAEPLVSNSMSEATRENLEARLATIESAMLEEIASARGLSADGLRRVATHTPEMLAPDALEAGLVDRAVALPELARELEEVAGKDEDHGWFRQVAIEHYSSKVARARPSERRSVVGVVFAEGPITGDGIDGRAGGERVASKLRELRSEDAVRAVVLRVNSPGGEVSPSEAILEQVRELRRAGKPVVASLAHIAASGGYWISSGADAIVAHPTTITGSIGVIVASPNLGPLLTRLGVHREVVKTAPGADSESLLRRKSEAEIANVQALADDMYDQFLSRVAEGRGKPKAAIDAIAQGRVWMGATALELGLVGRLGTLDDAISLAAEKASLASDYSVRYVERDPSLVERVLDALGAEGAGPLGGARDGFEALVATLQAFDRGDVLALLPLEVRLD